MLRKLIPTETTQVVIPPPIKKKIRQEAKDEGISMSAVIRRVLMRHYAQSNGG